MTDATRGRKLALLIPTVFGGLIGMAAYTFHYAHGSSYLSDDPRACVNCHIMRPQYDSWQKSSHHTTASCVECHLPHDVVPKYVAKSIHGWNHSKGFTLQDFAEPIRLTDYSASILQENCVRCHGEVGHELTTADPRGMTQACTHCHRAVGHGELVGLGGPLRAAEHSPASSEESPP